MPVDPAGVRDEDAAELVTALRVDAGDRVCVFVVAAAAAQDNEDSAITSAEAVEISRAEPRPGSPALTIVDGSLAGATVVADASRVPADRTCASS